MIQVIYPIVLATDRCMIMLNSCARDSDKDLTYFIHEDHILAKLMDGL